MSNKFFDLRKASACDDAVAYVLASGEMTVCTNVSDDGMEFPYLIIVNHPEAIQALKDVAETKGFDLTNDGEESKLINVDNGVSLSVPAPGELDDFGNLKEVFGMIRIASKDDGVPVVFNKPIVLELICLSLGLNMDEVLAEY